MAAKAKATAEAVEAATADAAATATVVSPTYPMCAAVGCSKPAISRCSLCLGNGYCSDACQMHAWPTHRGPCKVATEIRALLGGVNIDKFVVELQISANAGNTTAKLVSLGLCYEKGTGVAA